MRGIRIARRPALISRPMHAGIKMRRHPKRTMLASATKAQTKPAPQRIMKIAPKIAFWAGMNIPSTMLTTTPTNGSCQLNLAAFVQTMTFGQLAGPQQHWPLPATHRGCVFLVFHRTLAKLLLSRYRAMSDCDQRTPFAAATSGHRSDVLKEVLHDLMLTVRLRADKHLPLLSRHDAYRASTAASGVY